MTTPKGRHRNEPCPCGSGSKAKRCHPDGWPVVVREPCVSTAEGRAKARTAILMASALAVPR